MDKERQLDKILPLYKINLLFEFEVPQLPKCVIQKIHQERAFRREFGLKPLFCPKRHFCDQLILPLKTLGYDCILLYSEITDTKTIVLFSIATMSKYRCVMEDLVERELSKRIWVLGDFYNKSHSLLGGLRRFRYSVPSEEEVSKTEIIIGTHIETPHRKRIKKDDVRELLNSIYPSTFVNWKAQKNKNERAPVPYDTSNA